MAEAAVAGRFGGERERALKITKRALRLLAEDPDPLRAAWFWVQRARLVQALARGDGWQELGTAQDLVRGLPPSEVHAEVLAVAASWSMQRRPGPDALTAAERAVEYARMVGARETELHARLTLGVLTVESGDPEGGLAQMRQVLSDTRAEGMHHVTGRAYVNLPSALQSVGRDREAVPCCARASSSAAGTDCWTPGRGRGPTWPRPSTRSAGGRRQPRPPRRRSGSATAPSPAARVPCTWPTSPWAAATSPRPAGTSPPPAPGTAHTIRCPSTCCP